MIGSKQAAYRYSRDRSKNNLGAKVRTEASSVNCDRVMRLALQATTPFNFVAAFALAFPASWMGQSFGLPSDAPAVYRAFSAGAIALFGAVYGWLSLQREIDRPLVVVSACGKLIAFGSLLGLALLGSLPARTVVLGSIDLLCALIFFWWWFCTKQADPAGAVSSPRTSKVAADP